MALRTIPEQLVPAWFVRGLEAFEELIGKRSALPETDVVLWTVVIVAAVFDILTTMVGLEAGLVEGNAVAVAFLRTYGISGIGVLKLVALVALVVSWAALEDRSASIVLAGFAVISLLVVALNAITLAFV